MVKRMMCLLGLALCLETPPARCAPQSFNIRSVHVMQAGAWRADPNGTQTREQCSRFHLADDAATRWFKASVEVDQHRWLEQLDWTQCSASGTLLTGDGKTYRWNLDQSGRGQVTLSPTVSVFLSGPELPFAAP